MDKIRNDSHRRYEPGYLILGFLIVNLLAGVGILASLSSSRAAYEDSAVVASRNMADTLDQSVSARVGTIDITLQAAIDALEEALRTQGHLNPAKVNDQLLRLQQRLTYVDGIRATDANGHVLYGYEVGPETKAHWSERDFFVPLSSGTTKGLVVTNPIFGKVNQRWVLAFVRRYNKPDGSFAGLISASIPVDYFNELLASLDVGPNGVALMRDAQMGLIARYPRLPGPAGEVGSQLFSPDMQTAVQSGDKSVTFRSKRTPDGIERVHTYRRLSDVPFHLLTGLGTADYLAPWNEEVHKSSIGFGIFMLMTLFAGGLLHRSNLQRHRAQERIRFVMQGANDGIHALTSSGKLIYANDAFFKMLGREHTDNSALRVADWDTQLSDIEIQQHLSQAIRDGGKSVVQTVHRRLDGSTFPVEVVLTPQVMEGQDVLFCSSRDISERLKAEAEVRQSQETMLAAVNSVDEAFVIYDDQDRLVYCNERYRQLYATTADLIVYGATFESIVRKGSERGIYAEAKGRIDAFVAERVKAHQSGNQQVITHMDDGRVMRVLDRKLPNGFIVGFRIDITELDRSRKQAEASAESKAQFLANMSHEIRTPMNAIMGMLNLLESTELNTRQRDYAGKAFGAAHNMLGLLNNILDFSKMEAGKLPLEHLPFRLDSLLRDLSVVLSSSVRSKTVEVLFDIDPTVPDVVVGDGMRLQQVLVNLGGNAVKFTEQGQVVIGLRVLHAGERKVVIAFSVQDSGIGIAPEHQAQIFTGFSQAEASTTRRFGGTGLGLTISKSLVELMGGTLALDSAPGRGSTFGFELEFPVPAEVPEELQVPTRPPLAKQRVLIVDDNPVADSLLRKMVQSLGWEAECVESGRAAVEHIQQVGVLARKDFPYSLILMDWQMPDMDGWQTTHQIRSLARACTGAPPVIIMLSANGRQELALRSAEEQALVQGILVKPVTASLILDAVMNAGSENAGLRKRTAARASKRQLAGMRILVVEDNLINQQVAEELLSAEGAIVSMAANGQLGVDAVRAAAPQFDVVLMDVQMPVLDGYAATGVIRQDLGLGQLPIIAMTANAMPGDRETCMDAGMNEHIGKPFDMARLISLLIRITGFVPPESLPLETGRVDTPAQPDLPEIEGLDLKAAVARMSGARSLYRRTAQDFLGILANIHTDLLAQWQAGDRRKLGMSLHTLKGNAGTLGVTALALEAKRLEQLFKGDQELPHARLELESLAPSIAEARLVLRQAITALDDVAPKPSSAATTAKPPAVRAVLEPLLSRLAGLLAQSDMEALQAFAETRPQLESLPKNLLERLETPLQNLDFEAAHQACKAALKALPA